MSYNIRELRLLARANTNDQSSVFLTEAYFGKAPVKKIQDAMDNIHSAIMADEFINIMKSPEGKQLEKAIEDVFGFKKARVYWSHRPEVGSGPYTVPNARILHVGMTPIRYSSASSEGFYDKKHELTCYVQMDTSLVSYMGLTSAELTGILLHEIGHNLDFSFSTVYESWMNLFMSILNPIELPPNIIALLISEYGKGAYFALRNLDDTAQRIIPSIHPTVTRLRQLGFNVMQIVTALSSPGYLLTLPLMLIMSPVTYLICFAHRRKERFSDSFAAVYGYGDAVMTGLEKLTKYISTGGEIGGPILTFFYDIFEFESEFISFATGGHQSNQQRFIRIIAKLEKDLNDPELPKDMRKELSEHLQKCKDAYEAMMNLDKSDRDTLTTKFRRMVDNWYNGKPYIVVPPIDGDQA